jgi:hypothetical protein
VTVVLLVDDDVGFCEVFFDVVVGFDDIFVPEVEVLIKVVKIPFEVVVPVVTGKH